MKETKPKGGLAGGRGEEGLVSPIPGGGGGREAGECSWQTRLDPKDIWLCLSTTRGQCMTLTKVKAAVMGVGGDSHS